MNSGTFLVIEIDPLLMIPVLHFLPASLYRNAIKVRALLFSFNCFTFFTLIDL